jgi:arabinogalactan oligomer/maltooligosaccharide transport system permease protein
VALVFALIPVIFVLSASLNPAGTLTGSNHLFATIAIDNYQELFDDPFHPYGSWFVNTMVIAITTAIGTVFLGACAAYAFSRYRFKGRRAGLMGLLLVQMFPQLIAYVAIFLLMLGIGELFPAIGLGSQLGLIMVYLGGALGVNTWLIKGFFDTVPRSIDESAVMDGASHAVIFYRVVLPLVTPILAVVGLLSFVNTSAEFVLASVVLGDDPSKQTLAVGLFSFVSQQFSENWGVFAAGAILAALPVVLLFQFLQRYIAGGLIAGSVKE